MKTIENRVQHTCTHIHTHKHTLALTLVKTEQAVSSPLETQISIKAHTFDTCFLFIFVFFVFFTISTFLGHNTFNRDNRMCCEYFFKHVQQDLQGA